MRAIPSRPPTQHDRLTVLEAWRGDVDKKLEPMVTQLAEIHELLFAAKAIAKLLVRIVKWAGGPTAVVGVGLAAWKYFAGH